MVTKPKKAVAEKAAAPAELKAFYDGGGTYINFTFARWHWSGQGTRSGLKEKIADKLRPGVSSAEGERWAAARHDLLLPLDCQSDYMFLDYFIERYLASQPHYDRNAYVQITFAFPQALNLQAPFELCRAFALQHLVAERNLGVLEVLHAPSLAGSANVVHVHLLAFPRRLGPIGFGEPDRHLASDEGNCLIHRQWLAFSATWQNATVRRHIGLA